MSDLSSLKLYRLKESFNDFVYKHVNVHVTVIFSTEIS
jgi:hypothetical protein